MRPLAIVLGISVSLAMIVADTPASAQQGQSSQRTGGRQNRTRPTRKPTVSPYLNLFRPGASPGGNYNTLVRPQLDQQKRNRKQEAAIRGLNTRIQQQEGLVAPFGGTIPNQGVRGTGHVTNFLNLGSFFGSR